MQTGRPVRDAETDGETLTTREGGGLVNLPVADNPLVFVKPSVVSLGAPPRRHNPARPGGRHRRRRRRRTVERLAPATGLARRREAHGSLRRSACPAASKLVAEAEQTATEQDLTGFVVLQRGNATRRIPFWLRTTRVKLGPPARVLTKQGRYEGNARNGKANVTSYRYPDDPTGLGVSNSLPGPEQVFRVRVGRGAANVGVRITRQPQGRQRVTPHRLRG